MEDGNFKTNLYSSEQEEDERMMPESPPTTTLCDTNTTTTSSLKKSRRSIQKKVVSVPLKDIEGSRLKGDTAPPSDSWAWRKYGQKPIKGSPYPRGYYRCSSLKGCPARKQVERSYKDPSKIIITYSYDHNHPGPASRNNKHHPKAEHHEAEPEPSAPEVKDEPLSLSIEVLGEEFAWFGDMGLLDSRIFVERSPDCVDLETCFAMKEEDESLFADLEELPECSTVFRQRNVGPQLEIF